MTSFELVQSIVGHDIKGPTLSLIVGIGIFPTGFIKGGLVPKDSAGCLETIHDEVTSDAPCVIVRAFDKLLVVVMVKANQKFIARSGAEGQAPEEAGSVTGPEISEGRA